MIGMVIYAILCQSARFCCRFFWSAMALVATQVLPAGQGSQSAKTAIHLEPFSPSVHSLRLEPQPYHQLGLGSGETQLPRFAAAPRRSPVMEINRGHLCMVYIGLLMFSKQITHAGLKPFLQLDLSDGLTQKLTTFHG